MPRMDAAVPADAKNAPQGLGRPHKTRFPAPPTRIIVNAPYTQKT